MKAFDDANVTLVALSYDPADALRTFATERGITFPLLSDEGSRVIDAYQARSPDGDGVPHPGVLLIGRDGVIRGKLFGGSIVSRHSAEDILAAAKSVAPGNP